MPVERIVKTLDEAREFVAPAILGRRGLRCYKRTIRREFIGARTNDSSESAVSGRKSR